MSQRKFLVTGTTGKQGGAVARSLLANGHAVRAVTRQPDSPAARALASLGAEVILGETTDREAMQRAATGTTAVFAMSTPATGLATETLQGVTVADAAKAAGSFLVYTSVANADRNTQIPHFESKYLVEQHIRAEGIPATIIAPVYFMENIAFTKQQLREGVYPSPLPPARLLAQIAVADIAAVAVAVLEEPERYAGKRFDLAGDELTGADSASIVSRITGTPLSYFQVPLDMVRATSGEDYALMYEWFDKVGYQFDRAELAREFPTVPWTSFETWARAFDWRAFLGG